MDDGLAKKTAWKPEAGAEGCKASPAGRVKINT